MRRIVRNPATAAALQRLEEKRDRELAELFVPERPGDRPPRLPEDITELDDRQLMMLFRELTEWSVYFAGQLARAKVDELFAEAKYELLRADALAERVTKSVTEAKALADSNPEVKAAKQELVNAKANRIRAETSQASTERLAAFCSRELTRRSEAADRVDRSYRWTA